MGRSIGRDRKEVGSEGKRVREGRKRGRFFSPKLADMTPILLVGGIQ